MITYTDKLNASTETEATTGLWCRQERRRRQDIRAARLRRVSPRSLAS